MKLLGKIIKNVTWCGGEAPRVYNRWKHIREGYVFKIKI